jgi:hypothetical protein
MNTQLTTAINAVRAAKYLHACGGVVVKFQVCSGGRSIYIKCRYQGMRVTLRFSDHSRRGSKTPFSPLPTFSPDLTWRRIRYFIRSRIAWMASLPNASSSYPNHHRKHFTDQPA